MRVLIVEDDRLFGSALEKVLARAGCKVSWIEDCNDLDGAMSRTRYDCILMDLNMPGMPGEVGLKAIRARNTSQAVIVITARSAVMERIRLLDLGADDYLTKPVDLNEVVARVRAVTRRSNSAHAGSLLQHGPLQLHADRRTATWKGNVVPVTHKEFWLLEMLVRRKGQVHSRARLEETLYSNGDETSSNTVEVYIHHLRHKFHRNLIRTIRGSGYQIGPEAALDD